MSKLRFLWATALIVLCVGISAGGALAADSWAATSNTIPDTLLWNEGADVNVTITNDGTTTFDWTYSLKSVEGITGAAISVDRWGVTSVPVVGGVIPTATYAFDFTITAPPIATINYANGLGITPAVTAALDCNWMLYNGSTPILTDTVDNPIVINRFSDMVNDPATTTPEDWANVQIHQMAGRVPFITQGYPDGTFRAFDAVTRDQMAVFMFRALQLPTVAFAATFSDVPAGFWADDEILALVANGIVTGYGDATYRPSNPVTRDQMAVFVARGLAGGEAAVPTGPTPAAFTDVPVGYWAYDHIMLCVDENVVGGYGDGTFRPTNTVDRGQMAVFVYRAFIAPSDAVVVLAGPGLTRTASTAYDGWSVSPTAPAVAYVGFDAIRTQSAIDVDFAVKSGTTTAASGSDTVTLGEINAVKASAAVDGVPYVYATFDVSGLPSGEYTLEVTVNGTLLSLKPAFRK